MTRTSTSPECSVSDPGEAQRARLEREVHEALARLRTQSREQARRASRSPERL
jgi:hypothetical protein